MTLRIAIAGLLGAIAMFVWSSIAHIATPLATAGISQIPGEATVLPAMESGISQDGLYLFPGMDKSAPDAMQKYAAAVQVHGSGFLVYHPPGHGISNMGPSLAEEFLKQLLIAVIAAWLVSISAVAGFGRRVLFVSAIGVTMALTTNASYLFWYGFPLSYTLANMTIEFLEMVFAGVAIAWWLGRSAKA
jgi:hypothetical protein